MMTPQEVANCTFAKAVVGGYNMATVDDFLDRLTEDYTALYKENAALKAKLKVLADKMEEYRQVEDAMRSTLLTAQKVASTMVSEAEQKRDAIAAEAEARKHSLVGYTPNVRAMLNYVQFNLADPELSLHAIAQKLGVNASYLSQQFNREVGKSLPEYIATCRVAEAKKLLRSSTSAKTMTPKAGSSICSAPTSSRLAMVAQAPSRAGRWLPAAFHWPTAMTRNRAVMAKSTPVVSRPRAEPAREPSTEPKIQ